MSDVEELRRKLIEARREVFQDEAELIQEIAGKRDSTESVALALKVIGVELEKLMTVVQLRVLLETVRESGLGGSIESLDEYVQMGREIEEEALEQVSTIALAAVERVKRD